MSVPTLNKPQLRTRSSPDPPQSPSLINVNALKDDPSTVSSASTPNKTQTEVKTCQGIRVDLPSGKSPHMSYPFSIHDELEDPWDYAVTNGILVLRSQRYVFNALPGSKCCQNCTTLMKNPQLEGILQHIEMGVHENTPFLYHSIGGLVMLLQRKQGEIKALRLQKLNDTHKVAGKAVAIDDLKRWVMAVGSGKVEHVDQLVRINLVRKGGIRNLLDLYDRAAQQVYHPQNYTEEDELRGLLLWRLGGA